MVIAQLQERNNKYSRQIGSCQCRVDVYDVLVAFGVTCPARQHAVKKLLCAGERGKGDTEQDLKEAASAVARAIEIEELRSSTQ